MEGLYGGGVGGWSERWRMGCLAGRKRMVIYPRRGGGLRCALAGRIMVGGML